MNRLDELNILIPRIRERISDKVELLVIETPLHSSSVVNELQALVNVLIAYKVEYVKLMNQPKTKLDGSNIGITPQV